MMAEAEHVDVAGAFVPSQVQFGTWKALEILWGHHSLTPCLRTISGTMTVSIVRRRLLYGISLAVENLEKQRINTSVVQQHPRLGFLNPSTALRIMNKEPEWL
jgi:hypothetical protein